LGGGAVGAMGDALQDSLHPGVPWQVKCVDGGTWHPGGGSHGPKERYSYYV
jgi:hypothetical protein